MSHRTARLILGDLFFWVVLGVVIAAVSWIGREPWRGYFERLPELSSDG